VNLTASQVTHNHAPVGEGGGRPCRSPAVRAD
jgi:hypothetical protein